ncbi:M48_Ste24p_like domain containing protein [Fimbriimonadaceae bacterium]
MKGLPSAEQLSQAEAKARSGFVESVNRIKEYEAWAKANPGKFTDRVRKFAGLGWFIVFTTVAILLLALGLLIWQSVTRGRVYGWAYLAIGVTLFSVLRSLFQHIPVEKEFELSREDAPLLWAEVDKITEQSSAPPVSKIVLDSELNASAGIRSKYLLFGKREHVLTLGWALLQLLSADEARAVIAHEFGHFSGRHGNFGARAHGLFVTLLTLYQSLAGGVTGFIFKPIVNWYFTRFDAMMFVLGRDNEYDSDAFAARYTSPLSAAQGLVRLNLSELAPFNPKDGILPEILQRASAPPRDLVLRLHRYIGNQRIDSKSEDNLRLALKQQTDYNDSHPALSDRLKALDQMRSFDDWMTRVRAPYRNGIEEFFGPNWQTIADKLSAFWHAKLESKWSEIISNQESLGNRERELEHLRAQGKLLASGYEDLAGIQQERRDHEALVETLREGLEKYPENARLMLVDGWKRLTLDKDDSGLAVLDEAMLKDPAITENAASVAFGYLSQRGDTAQAEKYRLKLIEWSARADTVRESMTKFAPNDRFEAVDVAPRERATLVEGLQKVGKLESAFLVEKVVVLDTTYRQTFLLVFPKKRLGLELISHDGLCQEVAERVEFSRSCLIIVPGDVDKWRPILEQIRGSRLL